MFRRIGITVGRQSIAILALVVATSGGTAYAATAMWTGTNIVDGSLTGADVGNGSLTGADIANGSISSADLASGATTGTSGPLAKIDVAGPVDVTSAGDGDVLFSTTFTATEAGFVDSRFTAHVVASPDFCGGGTFNWEAHLLVDGAYLGLAAGAGPNGDGTTYSYTGPAILTQWVAAGPHTLSIVKAAGFCEGTAGGTMTIEDLHGWVWMP